MDNMKITKVGSRGTLFTFDDLGIPTNVYVINGTHHIFIIDTYLGPTVMNQINQYIEEKLPKKPWIIINSHSHWDHVWGNSLYSSSLIIAHEKCKELMQKEGLRDLERFKEYQKGEVVLTYPNLTFTDKIAFEEDQILIYHTPGHTEDEISVLDLKDKVLFVGDNLERPIPFIMARDLKQYIDTLEDYLKVDAEIIIGGHTDMENKGLIEDNLRYLEKVITEDYLGYEVGEYKEYHQTNMKWLEENK